MPADPPDRGRPDGATLADLGEDAVLAQILSRLARAGPPVLVGPGDDAAVLDVAGDTALVASTDTMVEGYDFHHGWSSPHDVGVKLAAQNLADVAAMGAVPTALLVSLAAPADLDLAWVRGLADGLAEECARAGAAMAGGDLAGADRIALTATALGRLAGAAVLRSGARPGDTVALAGSLGRSGAGLALLQSGVGPRVADPVLAGLVRDHLAPRPPYEAGARAAAGGAHALIDVSDGLARDVRRLAEASGAVLDLAAAALAPCADLRHAAGSLGPQPCWSPDPGTWVLAGGEDHGLLACFPPDAPLPAGFSRVGTVRAGAPGVLLDGAPVDAAHGWQHFRPPRA